MPVARGYEIFVAPTRGRRLFVVVGTFGNGKGRSDGDVRDFFAGFAFCFHRNFLRRIVHVAVSDGLGNGAVDIRAHARKAVLVVLKFLPRIRERDGRERAGSGLPVRFYNDFNRVYSET